MKFRPTLEQLDDRINPSAIDPIPIPIDNPGGNLPPGPTTPPVPPVTDPVVPVVPPPPPRP